MATEMVSIKKDVSGDASYASHLASGLSEILNQGMFCDVTIVIDDHKFQAHRAVLCASSHFFKGMFTSGFQESNSSEVSIQEGSAETFKQMLEFAYTGYFQLTVSNVCDILRMACYMDFRHAVGVCVNFAVKTHQGINLEDLFEIYYLAHSQIIHMSFESVDKIRKRLVANFAKLTECKTFLDHASQGFVEMCLCSKEIERGTTKEEEILQCAVKWLRHDWSKRKTYAACLLSRIRLGFVPIDRIEQILGDGFLAIPNNKDRLRMIQIIGDCNRSRNKLYTPICEMTRPIQQLLMQNFTSRQTIIAPVFLEEKARSIELHIRFDKRCYRIWGSRTRLGNTYRYPTNHLVLEEHGNGLSLISLGMMPAHVYIVGGLRQDSWNVVNLDGHRDYRLPQPQGGFYRYEMDRGTWVRLPQMPVGLVYPALAATGGCIYAIGSSSQSYLNCRNVLRYKITRSQWEEICPLPFDLKDMSTITAGDFIFVAGSCMKPPIEMSLYVLALNTKTCTWSVAYQAHFPILQGYPAYVRRIAEASSRRYIRQYPIKIFNHSGATYFQSIKYENDRCRVKVEEVIIVADNGIDGKPIFTLGEEVDQESTFGALLEDEDVPSQLLCVDVAKVKLVKKEKSDQCNLPHNSKDPFHKAMIMW